MTQSEDDVHVSVRSVCGRPNYMLRWRDPITGRRRSQTTPIPRGGKRNRAEAERLAAEKQAELNSGMIGSSRMRWDRFRELFEAQKGSGSAAGTRDKNKTVFNRLEAVVNPGYLRDITEARLSHFVMVLRMDRLSEETIKSYLGQLKAALNWAVEQKLLARLPTFPKVQRVKKGGSRPMKGRPITTEEFERMLDAVEGVVGPDDAGDWVWYLRGLWASGLRLSESLELRWDDDGRIQPRFAEGRLPVLVIPGELEKGFRDREHPMAPEFARLLEEVPKERRKGFVFRLYGRGHARTRLLPRAVSEIVSNIGKAAGVKVYTHPITGEVKYLSAHDLRRTFGDRWAARVMPPQLMELMRHQNIETTLRYYVGVNAQENAQRIWAAFERHAPAGAQESIAVPKGNKRGNNCPSDHQKTSRPGVIRTHDQGIMSPLL